jgi:hypothetical protein
MATLTRPNTHSFNCKGKGKLSACLVLYEQGRSEGIDYWSVGRSLARENSAGWYSSALKKKKGRKNTTESPIVQ